MGKKNAKSKEQPSVSKQVKTHEDPESYFRQNPIWSFSLCDFEHEKWGICKDIHCVNKVLKKLKAYQQQTWNDILTDKSGRNGNTKNHGIPFSLICRDAQKRASYFKLDQYDTIHSLTIDGKHRLWGILEENIFHIVWSDPQHEIYEVSKRHT